MEEKIVILGVANGGKTSLLRTLKREFKSLADLKPTKGIERTSLNFFNKKIITINKVNSNQNIIYIQWMNR